jgi:dihydrodipicolinate synthase/N-acetylneuraminate lyase
MRFTKHVLKERGIVDSLHVRAPLPEMDAHAITDMRVMLSDLQAHFS